MSHASNTQISRAAVRKLLNAILNTDPDLDAFALDYFPEVKQRFTAGMERILKVNLLLEKHSISEIIEKLHELDAKQLSDQAQALGITLPGEEQDLWPAMSANARQFLQQAKIAYIEAGFPAYRLWNLFPGPIDQPPSDDVSAILNELHAHELIEPINMIGTMWCFTAEAIDLIMQENPLSREANSYILFLAREYQKQGFPSYKNWMLEINDEEAGTEKVFSELAARGIIAGFTVQWWRLTEYGRAILLQVIQQLK